MLPMQRSPTMPHGHVVAPHGMEGQPRAEPVLQRSRSRAPLRSLGNSSSSSSKAAVQTRPPPSPQAAWPGLIPGLLLHSQPQPEHRPMGLPPPPPSSSSTKAVGCVGAPPTRPQPAAVLGSRRGPSLSRSSPVRPPPPLDRPQEASHREQHEAVEVNHCTEAGYADGVSEPAQAEARSRREARDLSRRFESIRWGGGGPRRPPPPVRSWRASSSAAHGAESGGGGGKLPRGNS